MTSYSSTTIRAAAKAIISGEHAMVYGQPAITTTINRYCQVTATLTAHPESFLIENEAPEDQLQFLQDLLKTICTQLSISLKTIGLRIKIHSEIEVGYGMGSSAAVIVSTLMACMTLFNKPLISEDFFKLAKQLEDRVHGKSSGIDIQTVWKGGGFFQQGKYLPLPAFSLPIFLINTGKPESTTKDCVEHARPFLTQGILGEFNKVTTGIFQILSDAQTSTLSNLSPWIQRNHRLLVDIGVVPSTPQKFIADIEASGACAKITGAGSVRGESAGMILAFGSRAQLEPIARDHHYPLIPITLTHEGACLVSS